jgi:hypothetical protein
MNDLHYITNEIAVYASTISATSISTADKDSQGYLENTGGNRGISHGIATDGIHMLYVTTNGGDRVIPDDVDDAILVCFDLSDDGGDNSIVERVKTGAGRILLAVEEVSRVYAGNEAAAEQLEWFADKAREVINACDEDAERVTQLIESLIA